MSVINKLAIKLNDGNFAIIQSWGNNIVNPIYTRIGIILPDTKHMEFLKINNWKAENFGSNDLVKQKLFKIYQQNKSVIKNQIIELVEKTI